MIYLIDDKKSRQDNDYGWSSDRLKQYNTIIEPIYFYQTIKEEGKREEIFSKGNVILFHESFFDNLSNIQHKDTIQIRIDLIEFAKNQNCWVVLFSGSKSSRSLTDRVAHIPVSILYQNLEIFVTKTEKGIIDLNYLLYGMNSEIEKKLIKKLKQINVEYDSSEIITDKTNFIGLTVDDEINYNIQNTIDETFFTEDKFEHQITNEYLHEKVTEWFTIKEYDNIFIPLCFGSALSDYNGLTLAAHIRCTNTKNKLKPIYIYSFVDTSYLIKNEYFDILKTKNVFLIDYTKEAFQNAIDETVFPLSLEELPKEIKKLNLNVPKDIGNNHSIANEWGIYQLARNADIKIEEIDGVDLKKFNRLYFKWLILKNNLNKSISEKQKSEQKNYAEKLQGIKVLGKIDLTKFKKR